MNTPTAELIQQPANAGRVKVYRFKRPGAVENDAWSSDIYATRQAIQRFQTELIEDSEMEVDRTELDGYGRYQPEITTTRNAGLPGMH
jgi:hypothetical protein